ncbi:MAG TPA: M23 family metallopeptidase [Sphingobacteriaceae bacterium]
MFSRKGLSTIIIIDHEKGRSRSLNIPSRHICNVKHYLALVVAIVLCLLFASVMLYGRVKKNEDERRRLTSRIIELKGQIPAPMDSVYARNYIESIESRLEKINRYLRERGVKGFSSESVGGDDQTESFTLPERYRLFDRYLENVFSGLMSTPIGFPGHPAITSSYGYRNNPFHSRRGEFHSGVDFKGRKGDHVKSTAAGVVVFAGWDDGYGNCVRIKHRNGYQTLYGHLSKVLVSEGSSIGAGKVIGLIGSTGRSTGNHLHYEVRRNNKAVDPVVFLNVQ